jgi:hypothetical protein
LSEVTVPIDAKQAAVAARKYLVDLVGGVPYNLTLEEVERSSDGRKWLVTLGYVENLYLNKKSYKLITIDAHTGDVTSMKIYAPKAS